MTLLQHRRFLILLLLVGALMVESASLKGQYRGLSSSSNNDNSKKKNPTQSRVLQKDDNNDKNNNNNNNDKNNNNKDDNGKNNDKNADTDREDDENNNNANIVMTTLAPTDRPTQRPTITPLVAEETVLEDVVDEAFLDPSLEVDEDQPAAVIPIIDTTTTTDDNEDEDATTTTEDESSSTSTSITLSMADLKDIQFMQTGTVTLRLSLWFQDGRQARDVESGSTAMNQAVLLAVQKLLCQGDDAVSEADQQAAVTATNNANYNFNTEEEDNTDDNSADGLESEELDLCVIKTELSVGHTPVQGQVVEGSILMQPPTSYVVDRSSEDGLQWTTWRLTWNVLRLGTFYITQGMQNAVPATTNTPTTNIADMSNEDFYRSGILAMEQVLDLALRVSVEENGFDPLLVTSMAAVGGDDSGLVVASVYGEEEASLTPKLEVLGLTGGSSSSSTGSSSNVIQPTNSSLTSVTADGDDDDEYDDDRYSMEFGITEQLDPVFWHPLRIVGIFLFALTTAALVTLSCMSKKRQARRELEQKMAKESKGLLNNPQGVEDMLRASGRRGSKGGQDDDDNDDDDDDKDAAIPLSNNLKVNR